MSWTPVRSLGLTEWIVKKYHPPLMYLPPLIDRVTVWVPLVVPGVIGDDVHPVFPDAGVVHRGELVVVGVDHGRHIQAHAGIIHAAEVLERDLDLALEAVEVDAGHLGPDRVDDQVGDDGRRAADGVAGGSTAIAVIT